MYGILCLGQVTSISTSGLLIHRNHYYIFDPDNIQETSWGKYFYATTIQQCPRMSCVYKGL